MNQRWIRAVLVLAVLAVPVVSGCASKNAMTTTAAAAGTAGSLYTSLGGSAGVTNLANAFGANLKTNPAVSKVLDDTAIALAQSGLYNTIASAAGIAMPPGGTDLVGALSGKGLDAAAVTGVGQSLTAAANSLKLKPEQVTALTSLMAPISQQLLMGK